MKQLVLVLLFLLACATSACGQDIQLPPDDSRLSQNPDDTRTSIPTYKTWSGLDKLAAAMGDTPEQVALQLDATIDAMVMTGIRALNEKGETNAANYFFGRYNNDHIKNYFHTHRDLFDHAPWSQFLVDFYACLVSILGQQMVDFMHFDDLNITNYAVTVAFDPKNPEWDMLEYSKHFIPLSGCIAYWASYWACVAVTYGSGAIAMICSPIGVVVEYVMVNYIAPPLSDMVYKKANGG